MRSVTIVVAGLAGAVLVGACGNDEHVGAIDASDVDALTVDAPADAPPDAGPVVTCNANWDERVTDEIYRATDLLIAYHRQHDTFPTVETADTPALRCCEQTAGCCAANAADWSTGVWPMIGFAIDEPQEFRFRYVGSTDEFWLTALADRDCDDGPIAYGVTCSLWEMPPDPPGPTYECRYTVPPPDID